MAHAVIELTMELKYSWKDMERGQTGYLERIIGRKFFRAKHTSHTVSFVVVTRETPEELLTRIRPGLEGSFALENCWAQSVKNYDIADFRGDMDPFVFAVKQAWVAAVDADYAKNLRQRRPHYRRV